MDAFEKELAFASEQGSQNWLDIRAGRFTSSENHRLMKSGQRKMTKDELDARPKTGPGSKSMWTEDPSVLADDTETYIREKVAETLTGQAKDSVYSHATAWGDEWEPNAAEFFQEKTGLELEIIGFVAWGDHAGGSVDRGIKGKDEHVEIKCPFNSKNQIDYLMLTDQYDLKRMYPEYYWQIANNCLFTKKTTGHFVAFDPRMKEDKHKMAHIIVVPSAEEYTLIAKKIDLAVKEKLELLKLLG